jgi:hypothetical protein
MSRLAYVFYIYIKANTHQTPPKLIKAIEEIQEVRKNLPLHLSQHFPITIDDRQWEQEHPWIPFQRYLVTHVLDFLELGVARVLVPREGDRDLGGFRKLAIALAKNILHSYARPVPRIYRLVWTVSAAAVAASVYISLDMIAHPHDYRGDARVEVVELLHYTAEELQQHANVAVHAAKGSATIRKLLPLVGRDEVAISQSLHTVHDLVQQLSSSEHSIEPEHIDPVFNVLDSTYLGAFDNDEAFGQVHFDLQHTLGMNAWDDFLLDSLNSA